jgi:DNA-binding MarR family transcriptional regulator
MDTDSESSPPTDSFPRRLPSRHQDARDSPGFLLWRVSNIWQQKIRQALKPFGLTHVQFVLLAVTTKLAEDKKAVNQTELARAAATDKMMTSQVVRALVEKGLLDRVDDPNDRRAVLVSPTSNGVLLINEAVQAVEAADDQYFDRLGQDLPSFASGLTLLADG